MKTAFSFVAFGLLSLSFMFLAKPVLHGQGGQNADDKNPMILRNAAPEDFHSAPIMPQCFQGAMERINRETGAAVFLVRTEASTGCTVPLHWHSSGEQITVVSGTVMIKTNDGKNFELKEGGYAYMPSRHVHRFSCSGPCVHFVQSDGPYDIHYVKDDGTEISLAEALKFSK